MVIAHAIGAMNSSAYGIMSEAAQGWNPSAASNHHISCTEENAMAEAEHTTAQTCACCGATYEPTKNKDGSLRKVKHRACSKTCYYRLVLGKTTPETYTSCAWCGQNYAKPRTAKCCSVRCKDRWIRANRSDEEIQSIAECSEKGCTKCGQTKPLSEFGVDKTRSDGRGSRCLACSRELGRRAYLDRKDAGVKKNKPFSEWTNAERERHRKYQEAKRRRKGIKTIEERWGSKGIRRDHINSREMDLLAQRNAVQAFKYWLEVKATNEASERYWAAKGMPWRNPRLSDAEQYKIQYRLDLKFQVSERMRRQVSKARKRDGIASLMRDAINRNGSSKKVERELGYSIVELMAHIEKQFTKRMTWEKFRSGELHIDHITPQAAFDLADDEEWRKCWCLSNLRPMWGKDNIRKRDAIHFLC